MKVRFLRNITVDLEKTRLHEVWDKYFRKWDELAVEDVFKEGNMATLKTYDGDYAIDVPVDAFEVLREEKKPVSF